MNSENNREARQADSLLIDKNALAQRLAISVRTVDNWMGARLIPYLKIRNVVRFDFTKVQASLQKFEVKGRYQ